MWFFAAMAGNILWVSSDILNSVLVKRFESRPIVLLWVLSIFELCFLIALAGFASFRLEWFPWYATAGLCSYVASLVFVAVLRRIDVSIMHAAWVFQAIAVSIVGFVLFGERWTALQCIGAALAVIGVLFVAFWHKHISFMRTVCWLSLLGILYMPFFIVQKAAVDAGETILTVFFWVAFFQKSLAQVSPWFVPQVRRRCLMAVKQLAVDSFFLCALATVCQLLGSLLFVVAFTHGLVSLIAIMENAQPFLAMMFAWILFKLAPAYAPRELLTKQSVWVKIVSFLAVGIGMTILATS